MSGKLVFTVGAVLRGDDAAGPMLARMIQDKPIDGWQLIDGEQMPEDFIAPVRRMQPDKLVLVDAAMMGLSPGEVRFLSRDDVLDNYMLSTHSLPLSFLLDELSLCCSDITFLGIQPAQMDFAAPLTSAVYDAVKKIYAAISKDDFSEFC